MGNSGSINNVAADLDDLHPYVQHSQTDHQRLKWTQSFPRESSFYNQHYQQQQAQQQHIKVLPDINDNPRLRCTSNGAILQQGGTISGRKVTGMPPPVLHRSKTAINYDLSNRNKPNGFNKSHTQHNSTVDRDKQSFSYKRFGSEPDLRLNGEEETVDSSQVKISRSKIVKNKKKKPVPPPPPQAPQDFVQSVKRDHNLAGSSGQQKKLRLFKTKAESKKFSVHTKPAAEASDLHFKRCTLATGDKRSTESLEVNKPHIPPSQLCTRNCSADNEWQETKVRVLPVPMFRREKSFDVSLLTSHNTEIEDAFKHCQERPNKLLSKKKRNSSTENRLIADQSSELDRRNRKSPIDAKLSTRKHSQPVQLSASDFKKELEAATKRRSAIVETMQKEEMDQPVPKTRTVLSPPKVERNDSEQTTSNAPVKKRSQSKIPQLTKTFYFGMEGKTKTNTKELKNFGQIQMKVIDEFAKNMMTKQGFEGAESESSESALSSEEGYPMGGITPGYDESTDGGIHVHVRPTLPRRQLEVPRFSPAAAWRMLNEDQKDFFGRLTSELTAECMEAKQPLEERIQRIYREPNPLYPDNKSGDSGISGDAGLPERTDSPQQNFGNEPETERTGKVEKYLKPWIPQQDLEEDSSSEGEMGKATELPKYSARTHIFSLSLPRESHLSAFEEKDKPGFSSLQKLKKTVSNAFFNTPDPITNYRSDNWLLSRSAPNSIENAPMASTGTTQLDNPDRQITIQPSSFSYFTGGRHVMYLPNHPIGESKDYHDLDRDPDELHRKNSFDLEGSDRNREENYSSNARTTEVTAVERENLQDQFPQMHSRSERIFYQNKNHRFTFQSTVRQIERRRIAEKLSKEAEKKEAQRLSELEAMRKVEEEFQRKRAREKASIRHQLRLFSLEENQCASLPVDWQGVSPQNQRAEPDGAVSSPTSSPTSVDTVGKSYYNKLSRSDQTSPVRNKLELGNNFHKVVQGMKAPIPGTEVLSEFRTMRREYVEYRSGKKYDFRHDLQTEHPPVVCKIPPRIKELSAYGCEDEFGVNLNDNLLLDNYRKDLIHGRSACSSDSELSVPSAEGAGDCNRTGYRCRSRSPSL